MRSGMYVDRIEGVTAGIPPSVPAIIIQKSPDMFDPNQVFIEQPVILYDTLIIPDTVDPTDPFYPPILREWEFFRVARGAASAVPGGITRKLTITETNLTEPSKIPLTRVMRIDEIGIRVIPTVPNLGIVDPPSVYYFSHGIAELKIEDNERLQFPIFDGLKAGGPNFIAGKMHDPNDSVGFDLAGLDAPVFDVGGLPADGYILDSPFWLRPGIHFYIKLYWIPDANFVTPAFNGNGLKPLEADPYWKGMRIQVMLYGATWINATKL